MHRGFDQPLRRRLFELPVTEDVDREIAFHLEMRAEELEEDGWERHDARLEAERLFGDRESAARACRDLARKTRRARRRSDMFDALRHDLRYGFRNLIRYPAFTAVALATLALGIGATSAIYSVFHGVLLSPLPYPQPDRLLSLRSADENGREMRVPYANFADWRAETPGLTDMAVHSLGSANTIQGGDVPVRVRSAAVSAGFFPVLGVTPRRGRTFLPEESRLGADPAVVISDRFWQTHLGGRPIDTTTLRFRGTTYRVVGVMPPSFSFPSGVDLWYPQELSVPVTSRTAHNWSVVARLEPDAELRVVDAALDTLATRLLAEYADDNWTHSVAVRPLLEELTGSVDRPLKLILGASLVALLVAAINLASTLLARSIARERELAVRAAIGAGRRRVVRQLLTETVLLTLLGGLAGLAVAAFLIRAFRLLAPSSLPRLDAVSVDARVFLFALAVSVATGLAAGFVPALRASRTDLRGVLAEGGRQPGGGRGRAWNLLVAIEVALAVVLLVGSGLLVHSFWKLTSVDPGFTSEEVLTAALTVPEIRLPAEFEIETYRQWEARIEAFYRELLAGLDGLAGARRIGFINQLPLGGSDGSGAVLLEGETDEQKAVQASYRVVGGDYFGAMGIPVVRGRAFAASDASGPHVAMVNEAFVERYFRGENPVGREILSFGMDLDWETWMEVVGVVGNVRHRSLSSEARPEIYVPFEQRSMRALSGVVVVQAEGTAASLADALRARWRELHPELPAELLTMETRRVRSLERERFLTILNASFALLALSLAALGIYGVLSYSVARRTREMGIRIALGARPSSVVRLVVSDAARVVGAGLVLGVIGALALGRLLESQLFDTRTTDPVTFVAVVLVVALAAAVASWIPARRGTRIDPLRAILDE